MYKKRMPKRMHEENHNGQRSFEERTTVKTLMKEHPQNASLGKLIQRDRPNNDVLYDFFRCTPIKPGLSVCQ